MRLCIGSCRIIRWDCFSLQVSFRSNYFGSHLSRVNSRGFLNWSICRIFKIVLLRIDLRIFFNSSRRNSCIWCLLSWVTNLVWCNSFIGLRIRHFFVQRLIGIALGLLFDGWCWICFCWTCFIFHSNRGLNFLLILIIIIYKCKNTSLIY